MSDEEVTVETTDGQILAAEYKDGQLQIVEVSPFDKGDSSELPDLSDGAHTTKYMQILDSNKELVQLDLLNLTLVRCPDGEDGYQLIANTTASDIDASDTAVACVLQGSDTEVSDPDNQDSYVMVESENGEAPLVFLESTLNKVTHTAPQRNQTQPQKPMTPTEILEKAKAIQKAKCIVQGANRRSRKRKCDLPPPHELLSSPNFKLFLYSCKLCSFKCNAVKEMSTHKATEHGAGSRRGHSRGGNVTLQCARCPYRGNTHSQLMKHVQDIHTKLTPTIQISDAVDLDTEEVEAADVLVCGACGFESASRKLFRKHIEDEHGATTL